MKFVHTFWSKPLMENKFNTYNESIKNIFSNYAYSAACVQHLGEKIILVADKVGAELLSFIPYDDVIIINNMDGESKHFAAQMKFEALKRCDLGDVLIDGDLFITKQEAMNRIKSYSGDMLYSFFETFVYTLQGVNPLITMDLLISKLEAVEYEAPYRLPRRLREFGWSNTSLMKFNNQELLAEYIRQYEHHKNLLKDVDFEKSWPDVILEQRFLTLLFYKYNCDPVIKEAYPSKEANDTALSIGYTHLGSNKSAYYSFVMDSLRKLSPDLHTKTQQNIEIEIKK